MNALDPSTQTSVLMKWHNSGVRPSVWHDMVWYGMAWYGMVWYAMAWHGMAWHGMAQHSTVQYSIHCPNHHLIRNWQMIHRQRSTIIGSKTTRCLKRVRCQTTRSNLPIHIIRIRLPFHPPEYLVPNHPDHE